MNIGQSYQRIQQKMIDSLAREFKSSSDAITKKMCPFRVGDTIEVLDTFSDRGWVPAFLLGVWWVPANKHHQGYVQVRYRTLNVGGEWRREMTENIHPNGLTWERNISKKKKAA